MTNTGPRRARSLDSYLRQTRVAAILALAALLGAVVSDATSAEFWDHHGLLTSLAASLIIVMLSVAVINEVLERSRRQRWAILAQYVMYELVRNARMTWSGVLEVAGLLPTGTSQPVSVDDGASALRDTARLTAALRAAIDTGDGCDRIHSEVAFLAEQSDKVLSRWATVMLNADVYAEIIDRHVELAGDITWIASLFDNSHPPPDLGRQKRARNSPAVQIEPEFSNEWLVDRIVVVAQLAEELDRGTLDLALRIVPVEWWQARLHMTVSVED
jgi:hypothetical protein